MGTLFTALGAAAALAGTDIIPVHQGGARALGLTGAQLLTYVGGSYLAKSGGTMTGALTLPAGTVGAPSLLFTGSAATTGLYASAVNEVSVAISGLQRLIVSSGGIYAATNTLGMSIDTGYVSLGASNDIRFYRDAAATLAQRNGTTQQISRIYNTYTDASNYERLTLTGVAGTSVNITAETLGTGGDNLDIVLTPAGTGRVRMPSGAYNLPGIAFNAYPTTGFWLNSGGDSLYATIGAVGALKISALTIGFHSAGVLSWSSSGVAGQNTPDAGFSRNADGVVEFNNGTAGTYRDVKLRNLLAGGGNGSYVQTPSMTVANLAAAATAGAGARAFVTDANATTFLSTVAAGGSNKVPVVSDGTNWLIG